MRPISGGWATSVMARPAKCCRRTDGRWMNDLAHGNSDGGKDMTGEKSIYGYFTRLIAASTVQIDWCRAYLGVARCQCRALWNRLTE